jgi:hypothetical protein
MYFSVRALGMKRTLSFIQESLLGTLALAEAHLLGASIYMYDFYHLQNN